MDFNEKYRRDEFVDFLRHVFMPEDFEEFDESLNTDLHLSKIRRIKKIGESNSLDLDVYEITHQSEGDPRVTLTREAFAILKKLNRYNALAVFKSENSENYRFSFMTIGIKPEGNRINYEYSNPKRYSFFLGPEAKVITPKKFLVDRGRVKDLKDLEDRFSIEVVNKEFYKNIAFRFTELVGGEREIGSRREPEHFDPLLKLPQTADHKTLQEFGVRTLGRVIFCWFLKKKKIPGRDEGLIPEHILSKGAVAQISSVGKNYYHHILENLFFEVLNTPYEKRKSEFKRGIYSEIPFLNGGLFEPIIQDFYNYDEVTGVSKFLNTLIVPNEWFIKLFDLLETYNFTIDENSSFDTDLSVDPEMLGRIFENLLAEIAPETGKSARKSTGSYYTPRPIVEYMVDESLKQYLKTKTDVDEDKLSDLLKYENDVNEDISIFEKNRIINALGEMKILDPACGSGAFPMGILQKSVLILQKIDREGIQWVIKHVDKIKDPIRKKVREDQLMKKNWDYVRKLGIIQNSIYGVDIQEIAVEIAKLRTFLSLIVDEKIEPEKDNYGIEPLPNLEFKYISANTLIGLPQTQKADQMGLFEDKSNINKLKEFRDSYFESYGEEKERIKKEFSETQDEMFKKGIDNNALDDQTRLLSSWQPFSYKSSEWFDPDWMFGIKDGFDIVIGNPPYIQLQKALPNDEIKKYADLYKDENYKTFERTGDIYALFYEKGVEVLKTGGILTFISSNKWMRANYGSSLRMYLSSFNPLILIDLGPGVFSSATVDTNILLIEKEEKKSNNLMALSLSEKDKIETLKPENFIPMKTVSQESWIILTPKERKIKEKIERIGTPLKDWDISIYRGILTGFNEAFIIDGKKKDELIKRDPKSAEIIKPVLRGRDIKRYKAHFADLWLIATFPALNLNIEDFPAVKEYLEQFLPRIKQTGETYFDENGLSQKTRKRTGNKWYETQDQIAYWEEFTKEKIVWAETSQELKFFFDNKRFYTDKTIFFMISNNLKYLIGILNAKLSDWILRETIANSLGSKGLQLAKIFVEKIPIPEISKERQKPFEELVNIILKKKELGEDTTDEENKIDLMVYKLYDLTYEEAKIIDPNIEKIITKEEYEEFTF